MTIKIIIIWVLALLAIAYVLRFDYEAQQTCEKLHSVATCVNSLKQ